uniref:Uncharacterized protein n=1 Tax=viral metagenome TaxID=1070528 RepID=A0A6M3KVE2_9ZZZZ
MKRIINDQETELELRLIPLDGDPAPLAPRVKCMRYIYCEHQYVPRDEPVNWHCESHCGNDARCVIKD